MRSVEYKKYYNNTKMSKSIKPCRHCRNISKIPKCIKSSLSVDDREGFGVISAWMKMFCQLVGYYKLELKSNVGEYCCYKEIVTKIITSCYTAQLF